MDREMKAINDYLNREIDCTCGQKHSAEIKKVILESGALESIPTLVQEFGYKNIFLVYDVNTYAIAGEKLETALRQSLISFSSYIFPDRSLVPDEYAAGRLFVHFDPTCDLLIGIGSGTINDLCRFVSFKLGREYFIVATAPSMDGYASNVTPLIIDNMKITCPALVPKAIIGDLDIIKNAPMSMISAGVADILAKIVCITDWKVAHLFFGEYACDDVIALVDKSIQEMISQLDNIPERSPETIQKVMEALILSGIAISYIGNSRPASGSEHQMSHFWEMKFLFQGKPAILHGTKVGVATVGVLHMYKRLLHNKPDFAAAKKAIEQHSPEQWELEIKHVYESAADGIFELEQEVGKNLSRNVLSRLSKMESKWPAFLKMVEKLPDENVMISYLRDLEAPCAPAEIGVDDEMTKDAVLYAKDLRNRLGILQILFDLGLNREYADELIAYYHGIG